MVRAPCCDKVGLKKGPWTHEEDRILVAFVQKYGHSNWRALPKQAGLLRCGKSCRLRWINYLSPHIKRGNFTEEEEEAIINLHQTLGNRWSAIAARLPGRTDNEIKNVWHTHLKKRIIDLGQTDAQYPKKMVQDDANTKVESRPMAMQNNPAISAHQRLGGHSNSPSQLSNSSDDSVSGTVVSTMEINGTGTTEECADSSQDLSAEIDDSYWREILAMDVSTTMVDCMSTATPSEPFASANTDDMNFWLRIFNEARDL